MSSGKGTQSILVDRGQFIFGRNKAAEELSIEANALYSIIKKFESKFKLISINSNNQYSIITICNYDSYQEIKKKSQQPNNNQTTAKQQGNNTYNNVNECNNSNNSLSAGQSPGPKGPVLTEKESKFLQLFNHTCNRDFRTLNDKAKNQLGKLLKNGFTGREVTTAIKNGYEDSLTWTKPELFTPEYITREVNFEKYLYAVKIIPISAAGAAGEQSLKERLAKQNEKYGN